MTERERKILMGAEIEPRTANETAFASAAGGGGGEEFLVTFVAAHGEQENPTCDKTFAQIEAAYNAGKRIVGRVSYPDNGMIADGVPPTFYYNRSGDAFMSAEFVTLIRAEDASGGVAVIYSYACVEVAREPSDPDVVTVEYKVVPNS